MTVNENIRFTHYASGIRLPDCSKLAINWKKNNDITIFWHDFIVNFFDVALFHLSSSVTGPSFMSISSLVLELWQFTFIRDWPEILKWEIPCLSFAQYLGLVRDTKFGSNVFNEMLLNSAKWQGNSFYRFSVIKGKLAGGSKITPPTQIRVK